jgi:HEAT repeat protein
MRRTKPTGVIHRVELKRKLVEVLKYYEYDEDDPGATAESYLNAAANRAGLLEERGPGIFAFWHPTFEEFLAAVELTTPTGKAIERLVPLRHDVRWREVILLSVGYVGIVQRDGDTATKIVEALAESNPNSIEIALHSHLRLAAACIADGVGVRRSLHQRILVKFAGILQRQPYEPFVKAFVDTLRTLPGHRPSGDMVTCLEPLVQHEWRLVRQELARLFSNVVADHPQARTFCSQLLTDNDFEISYEAAVGLVRVGDYRPEVWRALAEGHSLVRQIEPELLEFLAKLPDKAIMELVSLLDADDPQRRVEAAKLLGDIGRLDRPIRQTLVSCLSCDDIGVYTAAAEVISDLGLLDEQLVYEFISRLCTDDLWIRARSAEVLSVWGRAEEKVTEGLISCLNANDLDLRAHAAHLLFDLGRADDRTVKALTTCLATDETTVAYWSIQLLSEIGKTNEQATEALLACLKADSMWLRVNAASWLSVSGHFNQGMLSSMISCLGATDGWLRLTAAQLLCKWGHHDERVIEALTSCLSEDHLRLRIEAAEQLFALGHTDDRLVEALISCPNANDLDLWTKAVNLLVKLGKPEQVLEGIVKILDPQSPTALGACMNVLHRGPLSDDNSQELLNLVCVHDGDSNEQRWARRWLFEWLWSILQPTVGQSAFVNTSA